MTIETTVRVLTTDDAAELFRLRREALLDSPFSFTASPEEESTTSSVENVRATLKRSPHSPVFGAFAGPRLVGMLGLYREPRRKAAHKVNLWGTFVTPEWRGKGLAKALLEAAVAYARTLEGVTDVQLGVTESAADARRVYERFGFKVWGTEPNAIRVQGRTECEYHMRLTLT